MPGDPGKRGEPGKSIKGDKGDPGQKGDKGDPGIEGGALIVTAGDTIHGRRVVRMFNGLAFHPDISDNSQVLQVLGISEEAAANGDLFPVRTSGRMVNSSWGWNPGYVYCGVDGVLTQSVPPTGWLQRVARVIDPTTINVDIDTPFIRTP